MLLTHLQVERLRHRGAECCAKTLEGQGLTSEPLHSPPPQSTLVQPAMSKGQKVPFLEFSGLWLALPASLHPKKQHLRQSLHARNYLCSLVGLLCLQRWDGIGWAGWGEEHQPTVSKQAPP